MGLVFWGGVAVNLAVSVGVGLALPKIQVWITQRGQSSRRRRQDRLEQEYRQVLAYARRTDMLLGRLILDSVRATLTQFAGFSVLLGLVVIDAKSTGTRLSLFSWQAVVSFGAGIGSAVAFLRYMLGDVLEGSRFYWKVHNLPIYLASVPPEIRDPDAEAAVAGTGL